MKYAAGISNNGGPRWPEVGARVLRPVESFVAVTEVGVRRHRTDIDRTVQ